MNLICKITFSIYLGVLAFCCAAEAQYNEGIAVNEFDVNEKIVPVPTPTPELRIVDPTTQVADPVILEQIGKSVKIGFEKFAGATLNPKKGTPAKYKYDVMIKKVKRIGTKEDRNYRLKFRKTLFSKASVHTFKKLDPGKYLIKYRVLISKGRIKYTKWSEAVKVTYIKNIEN